MTWSDIFLLCFALGALWSFAGLLLGGLHLGHFSHGHGHAHTTAKFFKAGTHPHGQGGGWSHQLWCLVNPSGAAAFLAWFGGVGYLLNRHSGWALGFDLLIACLMGLAGAWVIGAFLRFLQAREHLLDLSEDFIGVLGEVAAPIREGGVGEVIYQRDGARCALPARSDDGNLIERGQEVIVTRFEKGVAYVRTWDAMTRDLRR